MKPLWFSVWVHLLLLANHQEENTFIWNGKVEHQVKGQFITGRKKLAQLCGVSESLIERVLIYLESERQIEQQKTNKYRLITIVNWGTYQTSDNKKTTKRQQKDTINNAKNEKNNHSDVPSEEIQAFIELFKTVNPSYEELFRNTTQRKSATNLIKKFGIEKMSATLAQLPSIIIQPYAPKITTPYELERDLGKLIAFVGQNKNITKNKSDVAFT